MNWLKLVIVISIVHGSGYAQEVASRPTNEAKSLGTAVDSDASDMKTQLTVAQLLHAEGDYAKAWQILRGLYDKNPNDAGVLMGLQAVMDGYKRKGRLNVDALEKSVVELLGKPHQSVSMPWGIRHVYGVMAFDFREGKLHEQINLQEATEDLFHASHVVEADLGSDPPWHVGIRQKGKSLTTAFLFPEAQSIAEWTELVTVERFVGMAKGNTLNRILEIVQEQIKANDANAKVTIVEQDEANTIFAVGYPANGDKPAQQQLVRLWVGTNDVHRLAYTHQGAIPSEQEGMKWFGILKNAKLKPIDPAISPTPVSPTSISPTLAVSPIHQVKSMAEALRSDLKNASQFKPTQSALGTIAATEEDRAKLQAYCDSVYKELEQQTRPVANPNQTEIIVFGPEFEKLPGGYTNTRQHFKSDVKIYGFKYAVPGESLGMSFDGAFAVEGKWYFLPKAHRAFR